MSKLDRTAEVAAWLYRPLCCRYGGVLIRSLLVRVQGRPLDDGAQIYWAIACHPGNGNEVLGAWSGSESVGVAPSAVMSDLYSRGVEKISMLIRNAVFAVKTPASSRDQRRHRTAPEVLEVAQMAQLSTARPALRRMLLAGEQQAQDIEKRLLRAVARNGVLVDDAAALEFVAAHLMRAEKKFDQESVDGLASFRSTAFAVSPVARQ